MTDMLLEVRDLSKHYGGLAAVRDLTFSVERGQIFGIAGPNGAGKTTLFDVISGHVRATTGEVSLEGRRIERLPAHAIVQHGLARTYQIPAVFPGQTVLANAVVGAEFGHRPRLFSTLGFAPSIVDRARAALDFVGLGDHEAENAGRLSVFDTKRLMIASALATEPRLMLFDEPVGGLNTTEITAIVELIRRIRDTGVTVLLIEHVMTALMALSDRVMIMNHGAKLYEGSPAEVATDAEVVRVYLGTESTAVAEMAGVKVDGTALGADQAIEAGVEGIV
ncbi:MAG: ABC transporter ATP-binding protein [Chloroflexota bacterium]